MAAFAAKCSIGAGLAATVLGCGIWAAGRPGSVAEVVALVETGVARKQGDGSLARALAKLELTDRLDDRLVEELQSLGAGPKTVAALLNLRDESARMPAANPPPDFDSPPAPGIAERTKAINLADHAAARYLTGLPDFICDEWVARYEDWGSRGRWREKDLLEIKLTYFDHMENYRLVSVNHRPARTGLETMAGAHSEGEFGSLLTEIFRSGSHASFSWDHWTTLRKHPAHVFRYRIAQDNSSYRLSFGLAGTGGKPDTVTVGEHGELYVDRETGQVLRVNQIVDSIPEDFPVIAASTLLDYDYVSVGDRRYLLPLHAEVRIRAREISTRNEVDFRDYRKFTGESTITFEPTGKL